MPVAYLAPLISKLVQVIKCINVWLKQSLFHFKRHRYIKILQTGSYLHKENTLYIITAVQSKKSYWLLVINQAVPDYMIVYNT